jgi:hypothetical protein
MCDFQAAVRRELEEDARAARADSGAAQAGRHAQEAGGARRSVMAFKRRVARDFRVLCIAAQGLDFDGKILSLKQKIEGIFPEMYFEGIWCKKNIVRKRECLIISLHIH